MKRVKTTNNESCINYYRFEISPVVLPKVSVDINIDKYLNKDANITQINK